MQRTLFKSSYIFLTLFSLFFISSTLLQAETYKFMDSSGNLHFVDRPDQVPAQYRNQVPALVTPIVQLDPKQAKKLEQEKERKKKELERKKQQEERKKQQALEKQRKEQEKLRKRKKGKKGQQTDPSSEAQVGDFSQLPEKKTQENTEE